MVIFEMVSLKSLWLQLAAKRYVQFHRNSVQMKEKLNELFEYNYHFNKKWIEFLTENFQEVPEKSLELINHLMNAQQIWNARIENETEFGVWQINDWNNISDINYENYTKTLKIIREKSLENVIEYQNSKGQKFTNKIEDVLFHIINHSTYHRAQIATDIKNCGIEPINTDYIFYKRKIEEIDLTDAMYGAPKPVTIPQTRH